MKRVWQCLLALLLVSPLSAEVFVDAAGEAVVLGEGGEIWQPVRTGVDARFFLNPLGDTRGDGRPVITVSPKTGRAEVIWSRWNGSDYDLALARWRGDRWQTSLLFEAPGEDLWPVVAYDSLGNRVEAWLHREMSAKRILVGISNAAGTEVFCTSTVPVDPGRPQLSMGEDGSLFLGWGREGVVQLAELQLGGDGGLQLIRFDWLGKGSPPRISPWSVQGCAGTDDRVGQDRDPRVRASSRVQAGGNLPLPTPWCLDRGSRTGISSGENLPLPTPWALEGVLGLQVHVEGSRIWLDWISERGLASTVLMEGGLTEPCFVPLDGFTREEIASARKEVRDSVHEATAP